MNKNLTWKQYLIIALICYGAKFLLGNVLPNIIVAVLEIAGLITLILGIVYGLKAAFSKKK
jgi:hypothetical protein